MSYCDVRAPDAYPIKAPEVRFVDRVYHPNVILKICSVGLSRW